MLRTRIWQVEWQTINICVFLLLSAPSPFFLFLLSEVWATCPCLKDFSSLPCAVMVHSSLCSDMGLQWKLSLELRTVWGEWVVLLWRASLPPLNLVSIWCWEFSFLSFIFWCFSISSLDLLIISWNCPEFRHNLIPCPCFQEERGLWVSLNTVAPCWNGGAADQTTTPHKEFGFLSCCTHLTFSFLDWTYTIYFILSSLNKYFNSRGFKIWFCSLNKLIWTINYYHF